MNVKKIILGSLFFASTSLTLSDEVLTQKHIKTIHAQTKQNWWQRRSPEFKALVITVGMITSVFLLRYGWIKGMDWLKAKRARQNRDYRYEHYEYIEMPSNQSYSFPSRNEIERSGHHENNFLDEYDVQDQQELFDYYQMIQQTALLNNVQQSNNAPTTNSVPIFNVAMPEFSDSDSSSDSDNDIPTEAMDTYSHTFHDTLGWNTRNAASHVQSNLPTEVVAQIRKKIDEGEQCPVCMDGKDDEITDDKLDYCVSCKNFICVQCKLATNDSDKRCPLCRSYNF